MNNNHLTGLILAAGLSGRMNLFKPLLEINGKSFLQIIVEKLSIVCNEIVIVSGFNSNKIVDELAKKNLINKCKVVYNEKYSVGMFSSLKCGLSNIQSKWILYHFIDQPTLPNKFYSDFINQLSNTYDWIQPVNKGRNGHPIFFNSFVSNLIQTKDEKSNLREVSKSSDIKKLFWDCNYGEIFVDVDYPKDFQQIINENNF